MRKSINLIYSELDNNIDMRRHIMFSSDAKNVNFAENLIDDLSEQLEFSSDIYGNILVSVVEAVNNAIIHGNQLDHKKSVTLKAEVDNESKLCVSVKDEGPGFDFTIVPDPTAPDNIEKPHGRGIFLMRNLADDVEFNDKGNEVILKFKLHKS